MSVGPVPGHAQSRSRLLDRELSRLGRKVVVREAIGELFGLDRFGTVILDDIGYAQQSRDEMDH